MFACIHAPDAGAIARSFSPWVEMVDEKTAVFCPTPRQLAGLSRDTHGAAIAVASTAEAAILAARNFPGFTLVAPGEEARVLGALPLDCLPPDPEIFQTLDLWGVRTLQDLARLPEDGLAGRLGQRGLWLQKLARGTLSRPLRPVIPETAYEESAELDYALELREPLLFLIGRFLFDLAARLKAQSLAAQALHLSLNGKPRSLRLPFPTLDVKFLMKLMEHSLETQPPEEPVRVVRLRIEPTQPRRVQHGLFTLAAPEPEKLELTLGKIRGLVGAENVVYPKVLDTHRPGVGPVEAPFLAFRYFRPPLKASVNGRSIKTRLFQGRILNIAGPWRTSGDWWRPDAWARDEFDLALSDGALYRLVKDHENWLVEGIYD